MIGSSQEPCTVFLWGWAHKAGCLCRRKARLTAATTQEPREAAGTGGGFGWAGRTVDRLVFVFGGIFFSPRRFCSYHIAGFLPRLEGKDQSSDQVQPGKGTSDLILSASCSLCCLKTPWTCVTYTVQGGREACASSSSLLYSCTMNA